MFEQHLESNKLHKLLAIAGIALALGIIFDFFFYQKLPGITFPVYVLLVLGGLAVLARAHNVRIPTTTWLLAAAALFFSTMVFVRASGALNVLNILATLVLMVMVAVSVVGKNLAQYLLTDYVRLAIVPLKFLRTALATVSEMITLRANAGKSGATSQIVKGIILTLPILVLFLILFSSADLVFAKYLTNIVNIHINVETVFRVFWVFAIAFVFIGAYTFSLRRQHDHTQDQPWEPARVLGKMESSILLGSVNVLFLLFVLIQLTYLFGGEANITGQGFTYAEYARKGFFELVVVAAVSFLLLLATEKYVVKKESRHLGVFKFLSGALALQVFIIIVSAFKRLVLYEQAYGFTTLRLFSHAFTIWLGIIFLLLLYKIFVNNSEQKFMLYGFISGLAMFAVINLANPDAFIARQNMERYKTTGKLDVYYLATLSEDAVSEQITALDTSEEEFKAVLAHGLYWNYVTKLDSTWYKPWQATNLSRRHGMQVVQSRLNDLAKYKDNQGS